MCLAPFQQPGGQGDPEFVRHVHVSDGSKVNTWIDLESNIFVDEAG
jgi:hypothetical protein